jgi:hypothetical protein
VQKLIEKLIAQGHITRAEVDRRAAPKKLKPCPFCSWDIPEDATKCDRCGHSLVPSKEERPDLDFTDVPPPPPSQYPPPPPPPPSGQEYEWETASDEKYCPWEDMGNLGFVEAIKQTFVGSLFHPVEFFQKLPAEGGYPEPVKYGILLSSLGFVFAILWELITKAEAMRQVGVSSIIFLGLILLAPIFAAIGLFLGAAITHGCLFILGGVSKPYEATFRVEAYAQGPQVFNVIPFIGGLVALIWQIVLIVIGLREVHETSTGKAVAAVLLPCVVCCVLGLAFLFLVVGGAIMGAMGGGGFR